MKVITIAAVLLTIGTARAQERIVIGDSNRTTMVTVTINTWKDVRMSTSFVDIMVRDPEIADVNPLTDHTLSILGKKIGTTRVSVYAENKKIIGSFDIEVLSGTGGRPKPTAAQGAEPQPSSSLMAIFENACAMAATQILTGVKVGDLERAIALCNKHPDRKSCQQTKQFIEAHNHGDAAGVTCEPFPK